MTVKWASESFGVTLKMYAKVRTFATSGVGQGSMQTRWGILGAANIAVERVIPAMAEIASAAAHAIGSRDTRERQKMLLEGSASLSPTAVTMTCSEIPPSMPSIFLFRTTFMSNGQSGPSRQANTCCARSRCASRRRMLASFSTHSVEPGRLVEEGLAYRNHPQWERIRQIVESEALGRPLAVQGTIAKRFLDPADIRNKPALGGGAAYDLGIYVISACNLVFRDAPLRVIGAIDKDPEFGIDRLTTALLDYGQAHATFTAASQAGTSAWATHQQFSILFSHGWLRATFPYAQAKPVESWLETGDESSVGANPTTRELFPPVNQYALQIDRFSRLVQGEPVRSWSLDDTLLSITIIEGLFRSAEEESWVEINRINGNSHPTGC